MHIDLPRARDLLRRAMETRGRDFRYNTTGEPKVDCFYRIVTDDNPAIPKDDPRRRTACIVGTALSLAGWTIHLYWSAYIQHHAEEIQYRRDGLNPPFESITAEAIEYFQIAQQVQDPGGTWGEAYDTAEQYAECVARAAA